MTQNRVLVVEDVGYLSSLWQYVYAQHFPDLGVEVATTVKDGLRILRRSPVDLLILDYHLPDGNGVDLLKRIDRSHVRGARVLVTANPYLVVGNYTHLYDRHMVKPVSVDDMLDLPRHYIGL
jgi:response regulator of citrate/malate metabolism